MSTFPIGRPLAVAVALFALAPARADKPFTAQTAVAFFFEAQDVPPFTPDEMVARSKTLGDEPEAIAADAALNQWKQCVQESLLRWAPLNQGPGTLIDGSFGRCADLERDYRMNLTRVVINGRQVIDLQLARTMTRTLEESWRPRLVAAVLDQALAKQAAAPVVTMQIREPNRSTTPAREPGRTREERIAPHS